MGLLVAVTNPVGPDERGAFPPAGTPEDDEGGKFVLKELAKGGPVGLLFVPPPGVGKLPIGPGVNFTELAAVLPDVGGPDVAICSAK
jgi:hypothetical protein